MPEYRGMRATELASVQHCGENLFAGKLYFCSKKKLKILCNIDMKQANFSLAYARHELCRSLKLELITVPINASCSTIICIFRNICNDGKV